MRYGIGIGIDRTLKIFHMQQHIGTVIMRKSLIGMRFEIDIHIFQRMRIIGFTGLDIRLIHKLFLLRNGDRIVVLNIRKHQFLAVETQYSAVEKRKSAGLFVLK